MSKSAKLENKSFQEKLKSFFKVGAKGPFLAVKEGEELVLTSETVSALAPPVSLSDPSTATTQSRMRIVRELTPLLREQRLEDHGVELLWIKTKDLLESGDDEQRREMFSFFEAMVRGQYHRLDIVRAHFFRLIKQQPPSHKKAAAAAAAAHHHQEDVLRPEKPPPPDLVSKIFLLDALTNNGKDVLHFEDEIGFLLQRFFPHIVVDSSHDNNVSLAFLQLLLNVIKYNSAYLEPEIICSMIKNMCNLCLMTRSAEQVQACLLCLDAVLCYSFIPKEALRIYIYILCLVVNLETHSSEAWRVARKLMGTDLGHSALYTMCHVIQSGGDAAFLRGAVFFVGMSLWGAQRVQSLVDYSPMTILPTFQQAALNCSHHLVVYEITLQTERLVVKFASTLRATGCDAVLSLMQILLRVIPAHVDEHLQTDMLQHVHNIINSLEALADAKRYVGSKHRLYDVIDQCSDQRPDSSVIGLIVYRSNEIYPTKSGWIRALRDLVHKYYKLETRPEIRKKAIGVMMEVYRSNRQIYENEILEGVIAPLFGQAEPNNEDPCAAIRLEVIEALTFICLESNSKKCVGVVNVLDKMLKRPLEDKAKDATINWSERSHEDVALIVFGLIEVVCAKMCQQAASFVVVRACEVIVDHLEANYDNPDVFGHVGFIRRHVFLFFMRMRANESHHLGVESSSDGDGVVHFSPFLVCRQQHGSSGNTYLSLTKACMLVIRCLSHERDWQVLKLVLSKVPLVLQNKAMLSKYAEGLQEFVQPLIELTRHNSHYPECLTNVGKAKLTRSDFHNHVYPVLAAMAPYNECLGSPTTRMLVNALQNGLLSRESNKLCIVALTACALEMEKSMYGLISKLLLNLSKISATVHIATPMLEFLSTLIRLPDLFSCFIDTHYMSVFAIALPFTNPFKFDPYTVALSHHVILMWFLKCRLAYRQNFVQFIITGLNSNVLNNFEPHGFRKQSSTMDSRSQAAAKAAAKIRGTSKFGGGSSNRSEVRVRSSSFSSDSSAKASSLSPQRQQRPSAATTAAAAAAAAEPSKRMVFHQELTETCIDFLARYMFANASVKSKRLPTAKFLLDGGQSASWIVGTMLITVTTSICDLTSTRGRDLCDRCQLICQRGNSKVGNESEAGHRRRHVSDFSAGARPTGGGRSLTTSSNDDDPEAAKGASQLERLVREQKWKPEMCACWCSGWAEIHVRRPSGQTSWICRVQNASLVSESHRDFPIADLTSLFSPSMELPEADKDLEADDEDGGSAVDRQQQCDPIMEVVEEEDKKQHAAVRVDSGRGPRLTGRRPSAAEPTADGSSTSGADLPPGGIRDRAHTVAGHAHSARRPPAPIRQVGRPTAGSGSSGLSFAGGPVATDHKPERVTGISPQFVFLTLFHSNALGCDALTMGSQGSVAAATKPLLIPNNSRSIELSIKSLDRIHAHETHKVGVIYIGKGQPYKEEAVLGNLFGSLRYAEFLHGLGTLIPLKNCDETVTFLGGLSCDDGDGDFTYLWEDDVMQVVFHVATMMPNRESDPKFTKKKRHIGNNFVAIVYNDASGSYSSPPAEPFEYGCMIRGQFNSACIVITPLDQGSNRVEIKCRKELDGPLGHVKEPKIVSDRSLAILVRQMALHCNLAAQIQSYLGSNREPYASNWLERLRALKRIRSKVVKEMEAANEARPKEREKDEPAPNDFTFTVLRRKDSHET